MIFDFISDLFRPKSKEEIANEIEEGNEEHYRFLHRLVNKEAMDYKRKYKEIIEYHTKKDIENVSIQELIYLGFISNNMTRKHGEEIFKLEVRIK